MKKFAIYIAILFLCLLFSVLSLNTALAHAKFVKSEPVPDSVLNVAPTQVTIWFSEELDTRASLIRVFDAVGAQVDLGNSKVNLDERTRLSVGLKSLANGAYIVKWHSVSAADTDVLEGQFNFAVAISQTASTSLALTALPATATPSVPPASSTPLPTAVAAPTALSTLPPVANIAIMSTMGPLIILSVLVLGAGVMLALRKQ